MQNNDPKSFVMLKKIEDVLPLLVTVKVTKHIFLLFKCPEETKEEVSKKGFKFQEFEDIDVLK